MMPLEAPKNSRMFFYLGFGLILLAILLLPMKTAVLNGVDLDYYWTGWILAPVAGAWGLASLAIWLSESSISRGKVLMWLLLLCVPIYFGLVFAVSIVVYVHGNWFWSVFFSLILAPCIITSILAILYATKKEKLVTTLQRLRIRLFTFSVSMAVPLLYVAIFLFLSNILT